MLCGTRMVLSIVPTRKVDCEDLKVMEESVRSLQKVVAVLLFALVAMFLISKRIFQCLHPRTLSCLCSREKVALTMC